MTIRNYWIFLAATVVFTLIATIVRAEPELLNQKQLEALFGGDLSFAVQGSRTKLRFKFRPDGRWFVKTRSDRKATGNWRIDGRKICRDQTETQGNWEGLKKPSVCFGIWRDGDSLAFGKSRTPVILANASDMKRIDTVETATQRQQQAERASIEAQKREIERQRLALEKERLAEEARLENLRRDLERQKIEQAKQQQALAAQAAAEPRVAPAIPAIEFGAYHAVVIGINDYKSLPKLQTALADARAVAQTLEAAYGFTVHLLENPSRADILDIFDQLRETLVETDNLLIYYAGHGWLDQQSGRGYWLPVGARNDRRSRWLSNGDLTDALKAMFAKHVMVVADSCYSGTLTRSISPATRTPDYVSRVTAKRARVVLSSGGLEPVVDSGGGKHSVFAAQVLKALRENRDILDGTRLFDHIRRNVVLNADQTPQYSDIRHAGHEGGDFLFVQRR